MSAAVRKVPTFLVYNDGRDIGEGPALSTAAASTARYYAVKYQIALP
jgi:hypothetical protein